MNAPLTRASAPDPAALIEELKNYIGFSQADVERLRAFATHVVPRRRELSQMFYDFILRNPEVERLIRTHGTQLDQLRLTWEQWADELVGGDYGGPYAESRLRVGAVHLRLGVEERFTVAAFNIVRQFFHDLVCEVFEHEMQACRDTIASLNRVLDLDLSLICHAYDHELKAETIAQQSEERRSLEETLELLLAAPSLLIISLDADGRIGHFNAGLERLLGLTAHEVAGRDYVETLVSPTQRTTARDDIARVFRQHPRRNGATGFEPHRLKGRVGGERIVTWFPTIVDGDPGDVHRECLWVGHDTTEERQLQEQIAHQDKMAAVGLLAAGVAHEIGNPLASISSVAQTLLRKTDDEYLRGKLDLIRTHIDRIATIVRRMVDFARPPRYEWRPCSINDLVASAAHILEYDKRAKTVSIELDLADDLPEVRGMEDQLTQVFVNLIINALDAVTGQPEDRPREIRISTALDGSRTAGHVVFRCVDTGPGIEESAIRRIFEPFYTTKEVGRGTGLGLSVSFRILEEHQGTITVEASPGEGSCFQVRLPVHAGTPEESR